MRESRLRTTAVLALAVPLALTGCDKKIWVTQYPRFWSKDLGVDSVAVYPFQSRPDSPHAGQWLAERLAAALADTGAYRVVGPGQAGRAQATLTGAMTAYGVREMWRSSSARPYPRGVSYGRGRRYPTHSPYRPRYYTYRSVRATVGCTASLVDLASGRQIHTFSVEHSWTQDGGSAAGANRALQQATDMVIRSLVGEFSPVRRQIVVGSGAIRTAVGRRDDDWRFTGRFAPTDPTVHVILELPAAAAFNRFRLRIVRRDTGAEVAGREIVWTARGGRRGQAFTTAELLARGGGPGKYVAELHHQGDRVCSRKFEIGPGGDD